MRLAIVESCRFFREVVALVAEQSGEFVVAGSFETCRGAGERATMLKPAFWVVGQTLGDGHGVDLVRRLRPQLPAAQWLLVLQEAYPAVAHEADAMGIEGIILKWAGLRELQRAMAMLRNGQRYRCAGYHRLVAAGSAAIADHRLTPREREVLHWVAAGKRNCEIAAILGTKSATVAKQMESIFRKLGVETRGAAVATWRTTCGSTGCGFCR